MTKKTSAGRLAKLLGIPKSRGLEAVLHDCRGRPLDGRRADG